MVSAVIPQMTFTRRQMVSVMNGMIGAPRSSSDPQYGDQRMAGAAQFRLGTPAGLVSSRYQSQNWFRVNCTECPRRCRSGSVQRRGTL